MCPLNANSQAAPNCDDCGAKPRSSERLAALPDDLSAPIVPESPCFGSDRAWTRRGSIREKMRSQVFERLSSGELLDRIDVGQTGGVYTVSTESSVGSTADSPPMAVFKSEGEEGFARRGIRHGTGAMREEAAYLIDRSTGCAAGVPVTLRTAVPGEALGRKPEDSPDRFVGKSPCPGLDGGLVPGAVQSYVSDVMGAAEDFGMPRDLAAAERVVSTASAQQIACLDIRLCNTDRHAGNLLFQDGRSPEVQADQSHSDPGMVCGRYHPVPIDHGCTLPRWWAIGEANFEAWADWPQVRVPCLPEVLEVVKEAYEQRDKAVEMLAELGLEPSAQATYYIGTTLLYEGTVRHGLSLGCVAGLLSRDCINLGEPSWLEAKLVELASEAGVALEWEEDSHGDRIIAPPAESEAWAPEELLRRLFAVFVSEELKEAGMAWEKENARE